MMMNSNHYKFFIGHKMPDFPIWENFSFYQMPNFDDKASTSFFKSNSSNDKVFGEYASLFSIKNDLRRAAEGDTLITICQYRRFVFNRKLGRKSKTMPWCMVLSHEEIVNLNIKEEYLPLSKNSFLIGSPINIKSIMEQYSEYHYIRDLLKFTSILIDLELLTNTEALNFLNQQYVIPAPSCGTFPLAAFIEIFDLLELAANGFWNNGYRPYSDLYQCRVIGFLLERLNSFLLLSYVKNNSLKIGELYGVTTLVLPKNATSIDVKKGFVEY
jgi:hypothetical protein